MIQPTGVPLVAFLLVVAFAAVVPVVGILRGTPAADRDTTRWQVGLAAGVWLLLPALFAWSGVAHGPAPFPFLAGLLVLNLVLAVLLGLSKWGVALSALPIGWLVGFHAFRLPLEMVLHAWAEAGTVPVVMSWSGQNFDVVTALLAIAVAPFAHRSRAAVWIFQGVGVVMLLNIVRIVAQSTPGSPGSPVYTGVEPPVLLAAHWPTVWIATVCVFAAVAGHVVVGRSLVRRPRP